MTPRPIAAGEAVAHVSQATDVTAEFCDQRDALAQQVVAVAQIRQG